MSECVPNLEIWMMVVAYLGDNSVSTVALNKVSDLASGSIVDVVSTYRVDVERIEGECLFSV